MRRARILQTYLLASFMPMFVGAMTFFVLILELVDLFANLWRYLALDVPLMGIVRIMILYSPTCASYALPISLLFAAAYTLGSLYSANELVVVFGSGLPLYSFVAPLLLVASLLSVGSYFFDDLVVLPSYREKNALSRLLLRQNPSYSNADVAVISRDGRIVYRAEFYDDAAKTVSGLTVIERDSAGAPLARVESVQAAWKDGNWVLSRVRRFERGADGVWTETAFGTYVRPDYDEPPESFRSQNRDAKEMSSAELAEFVAFLKRAGLPFAGALAERYKRYAFAFTPLVVVLVSCGIGGRFRKNVLLMSLLASLLTATGYYVLQMVTMLLAKSGLLSPIAGAWSPLIVFALIGVIFFARART